MRPLFGTCVGVALLVGACAQPEDRRWTHATFDNAMENAPDAPSARVYAFEPPASPSAPLKATALSDRAQAKLVELLGSKAIDPATLSLLAKPLDPKPAAGRADRTRLDRTIVISVSKPFASLPGDRLVRTRVTIKPAPALGGAGAFDFAGYAIAATDNRVQNIAHLEDTTDTSVDAALSPKIGGFSDAKIETKVDRTSKSTADIAQEYENLNVDITPQELIVTRESERGLDVVGNALIALTLAAPAGEEGVSAFLGSGLTLFAAGQPLAPTNTTLEIAPLSMFARCPLKVDVTLDYQLRRITSGREFYTEGKQEVSLLSGRTRYPNQVLVRAADAQGPLFQVINDADNTGVIVRTASGDQRNLFFDSFDEARELAAWMSAAPRTTVGKGGLALIVNGAAPAAGARFHAARHVSGCPAA